MRENNVKDMARELEAMVGRLSLDAAESEDLGGFVAFEDQPRVVKGEGSYHILRTIQDGYE